MAGAISATKDGFLDRLITGRLPSANCATTLDQAGLSSIDLAALLETQITSRQLDLEARRLGAEKRGFYSIGSAGHEGNAGVAHVFRQSDMAFLHYRSGAFLLERARKVPGQTPIWDMALSFVASREDPISGGRHKVIGSKPLFIPPQTSTIASHLPKAVGAAFSIALARTHQKQNAVLPHDSVVICSFGDASANHSTSQGAFNTAAMTAYRNLPLPIVFLCEDNGIGISVKTPDGWIAANYSNRPGLQYIGGDGRDIVDAVRAAREAEQCARRSRRPVFLHLRTVRLMGHAGSDVEAGYRDKVEIMREADQDPLLHTVRRVVDAGEMTLDDVANLYRDIGGRVHRAMEAACERPKLSCASDVMAPIAPASKNISGKSAGVLLPAAPHDARAKSEPQHMSRLISLVLADEMEKNGDILVFGEDVAKKGGVYGATTKLQSKFGPSRVFDTVLDEQTILGMAIGAAHNGYLPISEIQFLAYVHNAEDQLRGEAATLSFFSNNQYQNPMIVRVAGLAYQKGFGGHFHNDNSVAVFRDIPGLILACPSNGADAVRMMREAVRLAQDDGRVVIFLEPIALYGTKDLLTNGDDGMLATFDEIEGDAIFGEPAVFGDGEDLAIVTYGNGTYMARRAAAQLDADEIKTRIIDLRWLNPLPIDRVIKEIGQSPNVLVVDECRKTGSPSEELLAGFIDRSFAPNLMRITGEDSFVPLGPAANEILISEGDIVAASKSLMGLDKPTRKKSAINKPVKKTLKKKALET